METLGRVNMAVSSVYGALDVSRVASASGGAAFYGHFHNSLFLRR